MVYLPDHDWELGRILTSGVDVWLNTPLPPQEASGTSGMKASLNGVPSLSVLDGWWIEGCIEGVTGWAIDGKSNMGEGDNRTSRDADSLYRQLERIVFPLYYGNREHFIASDAARHRAKRVTFQYAAHGSGIHGESLFT